MFSRLKLFHDESLLFEEYRLPGVFLFRSKGPRRFYKHLNLQDMDKKYINNSKGRRLMEDLKSNKCASHATRGPLWNYNNGVCRPYFDNGQSIIKG